RGAERKQDAVVGGRRLQLEVEALADTLAERHAPGAVDPAAEGRVDDQLLPAGFVEEALGDDGGEWGGGGPRRGDRGDVVARQLRPAPIEGAFVHQPERSFPGIVQPSRNFLSNRR